MQKMCKQCGKAFEAVRDTAIFCSATCRSKARVSVQEDDNLSVQNLSVQGDNLSVQPNKSDTPYYSERNKKQTTFKQVEWSGETEPNDPRLYLCKGCQKPVLKNVDICSECVGKKITRKSLNLPEVERLNYTDDKFIPNYSKTKDGNGKKKEVLTYKGAIEKAIYSIASIGCDCIIGNKIYEASKVMKTADKFKA